MKFFVYMYILINVYFIEFFKLIISMIEFILVNNDLKWGNSVFGIYIY